MRVSLRFSLILIMSLLLGAVIAAITLFNLSEARRMALDSAQALFAQASYRVGERTLKILGEAHTLAQIFPRLPGIATVPGGDGLDYPALDPLIQALKSSPNLYSLYVGYESGDFLQLIHVDSTVTLKDVQPPRDTALVLRAIAGGEGERAQIWTFLDSRGDVLGRQEGPPSAYDPRQRPWYKEAQGSTGVITSEVYVYNSTGRVGFTLAQALPNRQAVFGVDLTIDSLTAFLKDQDISPHDFLFVLDHKGQVIAQQDTGVGERQEILPAAGHAHPIIAAAAELAAGLRGVETRTALRPVAGTETILSVTRLQAGEGTTSFDIGIAAPLQDFTGHLPLLVRNSLLLAAVALIVAILLSFWIAGTFNRTVRAIVNESESILRLDIRDNALPDSRIKELHDLSKSFVVMRDGLQTFGRYVPKTLVHHILDSKKSIEVGGERQELTALFTDIKDYTSISETMEPEQLMRMTFRYFTLLGTAIDRRHGIIDKFIGDAIMALWNAPVADPDHVRHACFAALEARIGNMVYNLENKSKGLPVLHTRFGIHTGEAVVGNVGNMDRLNYTAVGSVVNMASRLEGANKAYGTEILVSGTVQAQVQDTFDTRPMDTIAPKGADQPMTIFELGGVRWGTEGVSPILWTPRDVSRLYDSWNAAYALYQKGQWTQAVEAFRAFTAAYPDDGPGQLYLKRSLAFQDSPPGADWDGVTRMTTK
ncbi:adenylate/guanylate cyclase domain-containing protein [Magnetospira thiophila]